LISGYIKTPEPGAEYMVRMPEFTEKVNRLADGLLVFRLKAFKSKMKMKS
jgi:hypothetical protein